MPDLLLELFSEEIPSRMQRKAASDLRKLVTDQLVDAGLTYEGAKEYWTPRRLVLDVRGMTARSADIREEKKGPRTDAPEKAIEGFMRGAGLSSIDQAEIKSDPKKGEFYVAVIEKPGRDAEAIIAEIMPGIIRNFPWPKSMRWGEASSEAGSLRWVRPLQSILCVFGPETEETKVVDFDIDGLKAGNTTSGHRFLAPGKITVKRFEDYVAKLEEAKVIIDAERRKDIIRTDAQHLAFAKGLELVEDEALLNEVCGLIEWPTVLMGEFDEAFLDIPPEVIQLTIRENQKCFVVKEQGSENTLTNHFMTVTNITPADGGKEVMRGNAKVVNARLSDAKFFWETDLHQVNSDAGFAPWLDKLENVTFHAKLGSQRERVTRITDLAEKLATIVAEAGENASGASNTGESLGVSAKQTGAEEATDANASGVSNTGEAIGVSAKPTGAEEATDANASRPRSHGEAIGVSASKAKRAAELCKADLQSAMVFEFPEVQGLMGRYYAEAAGEDASICAAMEEHYKPLGPSDDVPSDPVSVTVALADKLDTLTGFWAIDEKPTGSKDPYALRRAALGVIRLVLENEIRLGLSQTVDGDLLSFFHDRLKVYLRDQGIRHDLIDAVLSADADDLLTVTRKARALQNLIETQDGQNLVAGYKRAANILAAEEKKQTDISDMVSPDLLSTEEEKSLLSTLEKVEGLAQKAVNCEDFEEAMSVLATLRSPIDNFFEHVLVNDEDEAVRANRLGLLARIRSATAVVADFSAISG